MDKKDRKRLDEAMKQVCAYTNQYKIAYTESFDLFIENVRLIVFELWVLLQKMDGKNK